MRVHQITYGMMRGDAISTHVLEIDARLRAWGYETAIYAQHIAPELAGRVQPDRAFAPFVAAAQDLIIFHYSIYSPNTRLFRAARGRKLLIYHNITPPEFFDNWDPQQAALCELGRQTLRTLCDCDLALGDSDYNRRELVEAGFPEDRTGVLPILFGPDRFGGEPDGSLLDQLRSTGAVHWLTVGRVVPNKALEDVVRVFYLYTRYIQPKAHLHIVGSRYIAAYDAALAELIADLGLIDQVSLVNRVNDDALAAYYRAAHLYLCASQHEGFCVPLVESMHFGVPILARAATAVPETLGTAGVLFTKLGYEAAAEMAHLLATDVALRSRVIAHQQARVIELGPDKAEAALRAALRRLGLPAGPD